MFMPNAYEGQEPYIFISYAHKDSNTVLPIIQGLQERGFRVWYDAGIEIGTEWPHYIATHLKHCHSCLAFVSPHAVESHNCRREINYAIAKRKEPLVIYLNDVELPDGMDMQLGTLQGVFYDRYPNTESFVNALALSKMLAPCKGAAPAINTPNPTASTYTPPADPAQLFADGQRSEAAGDYQKAFDAYMKAADMGHPQSQAQLGYLYFQGKGVEKNHPKAIDLFTKSSVQGNALGQHYLAYCYYYGRSLPQNYFEAVRLWKLSAAQNLPRALRWLAICYESGKGVAQDYAEAHRLYLAAAEQDDTLAQYALGRMYWNGEGTVKDWVEAAKWYRMAAENGHARGQCDLAKMYEEGHVVEKDGVMALHWYRKAAAQGYNDGLKGMGRCFEKGFGVDKDLKIALKWYELALSGADMYRLKKALNIPMPERSYIIVDDDDNPIDMSIYSQPLVSAIQSPLMKCRWCGGRHNPANGNICFICGGNND